MLFDLQAYTAQELIIVPRSITPDEYALLHARITEFPQKKWVNSDGLRGWVIPSNHLTMEHIRKYWTEGEDYKIHPQAKLMMTKELLEVIVNASRAQKRWEYLFEGKKSEFIVPCHGAMQPFDHQRVAVESMINMEYFGLLMEMGTGKTKCIVWEIDYYLREMPGDKTFHALIICPKSLRETWRRELSSALGNMHDFVINRLDASVAGGQGIVDLIRSPARCKIGICSYDSVRSIEPFLKLFMPDYLVCDESHYAKNPASKRFKHINEVAKVCGRRRILTGTPVSNKITDLWSQFEILRNGALGVSTYDGFKRRYAKVEEQGGFENVVGYQHIDELKERMAAISFVVKKDECLDLPDQVFDTRYIEMPPELRRIYDEFQDTFVSVINESGDTIKTDVLIAQLTKLSQICSGFAKIPQIEEKTFVMNGKSLFDISETVQLKEVSLPGGDTKMQAMLEELIETQLYTKVIVWARFHRDIDIIKLELMHKGVGVVTLDGRSSEQERQDAVDNFNNNPSIRVMVAQPAAGGVGLTLLGNPDSERDHCSVAYYYSNGLSFGAREQSEARNHRIGQKHKVTYVDWCYQSSLDERIAALLQAKRDLAGEIKDVGAIKELLLGKKD